MALLIQAQNLTHHFAARLLFENITFGIESEDRIGLIGPNGAGKSTLLRILAQKLKPDDGSLSFQKGLRVGLLEQVPTFRKDATVLQTLLEPASDPDDWKVISQAHELIARVLDPDRSGVQDSTFVRDLSGGLQKRVALARELMKEPDLLLLDEPTNHLDLEGILWLEDLIQSARWATLTITHDRAFLQKISNRLIELNPRFPKGLFQAKGRYLDFLESREEFLRTQELHETKLRNTLRREKEWLARGPQARLTKQQARIDRAHMLQDEVQDLSNRNRQDQARIEFKNLEKNPKKLIELKKVTKSFNGKVVVPELDLTLTPQTRLGLLGQNGSGKSTLLKILMGLLQPDTGEIKHAEKLQVAYFEQHRENLNPDVSLIKTICPDGDFVQFAGQPVHAKSYLKRFLFQFEQMDQPVGKLSGGEQARLTIAKMMLQPCNVLILDEPTNDLDLETLEVLQEVLENFEGALVIVSHDRYFLDQVSDQILAFEFRPNQANQIHFFSSLDQWESWLHSQREKENQEQQEKSQAAKSSNPQKRKKLGFKEQRELDSMEQTILDAEERLQKLTEESHHPDVVSDATRLVALTQEMADLQKKIEQLYQRWSFLMGEESNF